MQIQVRPDPHPTNNPNLTIPALHFQFRDERDNDYTKLIVQVDVDLFNTVERVMERAVTRPSFFHTSDEEYMVIDDIPILDALQARDGGKIIEVMQVTVAMLDTDNQHSH